MNIAFHTLTTRTPNLNLLNKLKLEKLGYDLLIIDNTGKSILHGRQVAMQETTSDFISFIDDDDETLLTAGHLTELKAHTHDCVFTNSIVKNDKKIYNLNNSSIKEWTLKREQTGYILPHQTFIFKKELYLRLLAEASDLIKKNGWCENKTDFVVRILCSKYKLWHYYPYVTYRWNISNSSNHKATNPSEFVQIRYFIKGK